MINDMIWYDKKSFFVRKIFSLQNVINIKNHKQKYAFKNGWSYVKI